MHRSPLALRRPPAVASDAVLASQPLLVAARGTLPPPRIRGIMPQATSVPQRADWCSGPGLSAVSECFPSILLFGPADDGDVRLWSGKYPAAREVTSFLHGCINRTGCTLCLQKTVLLDSRLLRGRPPRQVKTLTVLHTYSGLLLGREKNDILAFASARMTPDGIVLGEVSQGKTNTTFSRLHVKSKRQNKQDRNRRRHGERTHRWFVSGCRGSGWGDDEGEGVQCMLPPT